MAMETSTVQDASPQESAYSPSQITAWLQRIRLPEFYNQYIALPSTFPKSRESLTTLFRCQITSFPYENLLVHYSKTHLVSIKPDDLYSKLMGPDNNGRGGYCMELSIFFYHMLRGLGFDIYMTGVRNRDRVDGAPQGEFLGWTHINNIVHLPDGSKFGVEAAFGGDGPTAPLPMIEEEAFIHQNLGSQEVRLIQGVMAKQRLREPKVWLYQYRNSPDKEWNSFYSFMEIEFFAEDFEVQNWYAGFHTIHRRMVVGVRFLRKGDPIKFLHQGLRQENKTDISIVGKVMLVNDLVKVNIGGKTQVVHQCHTEEDRVLALWDYFGIRLTEEEVSSILGWNTALNIPN